MAIQTSYKGLAIQCFTEFLGTAVFMYLAIGGGNAVSIGLPNGAVALAQAFAFGFSLLVTTWTFYRISGAIFNPAVALCGMITGHISFVKFAAYFVSEILGAMLGVACVRGTTPSSEHDSMVLDIQHGESMARAFFHEFFLSTIACFVYQIISHEKNRSKFLVAIPNGLTLFACQLFAVRYDKAGINPARAFATSVVFRWFPSDHWIYWFGPLCGGVFAAALHILFRFLDFDRHSAGIDAENHAQYVRARAVYKGEQFPDEYHTH
ncbi:hypothetical protein BGX26_001049 [Mortierella sp. AD094]|nr:hypothetical protein BGX26_001049 [Mortierella sp. AD094]